jgi:hypothetical protein
MFLQVETMNTSTPTQPPVRQDRLIQEEIHDTYKLRGKLKEPTRCPQCGAIYRKGRWTWHAVIEGEAHEQLCSACHRSNDKYPAGEISISGKFAMAHKKDILRLARNIEATEKNEHPLNRIMETRDLGDELQLTTTDVHLPRRIGKAIADAWEGDLDIHFDEGGYFTSIVWRREK